MADADKTLITRAQMTSIAGQQNRVAFVVDGVTREIGDSGLRNITTLMQNVNSGAIRWRRRGDLVTIYLESVVPSAAGNVTVLSGATHPSMARLGPDRSAWVESRGGALIGVAAAGSIFINPAVIGTSYSGVITYITSDPWWSDALPMPGIGEGEAV